ncbi:hypothetical protein AALB_3905 [Agarivorans albus MKT 106]|uniref:Uncharacterized protein n=1 Tax=Agarivorans albus MKT 106 TaxID=1331007 RepID=R9PRB7_AGAAL|nr:hypothetical protein AALB_3905 [Agarivorans albus MKT 106]
MLSRNTVNTECRGKIDEVDTANDVNNPSIHLLHFPALQTQPQGFICK